MTARSSTRTASGRFVKREGAVNPLAHCSASCADVSSGDPIQVELTRGCRALAGAPFAPRKEISNRRRAASTHHRYTATVFAVPSRRLVGRRAYRGASARMPYGIRRSWPLGPLSRRGYAELRAGHRPAHAVKRG
jgi:hypothetical protein